MLWIRTLRRTTVLFAAVLMIPLLCEAAPTDPVTVTRVPDGQGAAFVPGTRLIGALPYNEYVEEEFFVSGTSTLVNYANNPPRSHTDITAVQTGRPKLISRSRSASNDSIHLAQNQEPRRR